MGNCFLRRKLVISYFLKDRPLDRSLISSQIYRFDFPARLLVSLCETSRVLPRISQFNQQAISPIFFNVIYIDIVLGVVSHVYIVYVYIVF